MAQTLEAIRGGGGSIKLGTIGTVSALMSRELDSTKSMSANVPSVDDEASSSTSSFKNHKLPENTKRTTKNHTRTTTQIPMLKSDDTISTDGTPIRQKKPIKKGPGIVEIVDIKCGSSDKKWVNPIKHRLKKLGFSKLSHSIV